jgi:hypothetical protein
VFISCVDEAPNTINDCVFHDVALQEVCFSGAVVVVVPTCAFGVAVIFVCVFFLFSGLHVERPHVHVADVVVFQLGYFVSVEWPHSFTQVRGIGSDLQLVERVGCVDFVSC